MGNRLDFTGPIAREHGVLPGRITNRLENASELEIHGSDLTQAEIAGLVAGAGKLESLQVTGHPLTTPVLQALAGKDRLQTFVWPDAMAPTDADAVHVQDLDHLRVFQLGHADVGTPFVAALAGHRHLWKLSLHDCLVDDDAGPLLAQLAELRVLSLARSFVTGATLGALASTRCAEIHLDGCDLAGPALGEALTKLSALAVLSLDDTPVGDELVHLLIGRPHLTSLSLRRTRITDQALAFFAFLPPKTKLLLDGTAVTVEGLAQLRAKRGDLMIEGGA